MASQTRNYDQKKLLGQVYTPLHIVEKILKETGFYESDLNEITVLDPACGDGRFLVPVVKYIVEKSTKDQLENRLNNIAGWDIDPDAIDLCRQNLDEIIAPFGIQIDWKLSVLNALEQIDIVERFDLIIGNPPYIRIQHLPILQRQYIQAVYSFCASGSTDTYVAFFQLASVLLSKNGSCGFITPNSFFTSETAKPLRSYFAWNKNLMNITNYGSVKVFGNTGTYAAVTIFGKEERNQFRYETSDSEWNYVGRNILFSELADRDQWHLSVNETIEVVGRKLGEICQISVGVTTLSDSLYLFSIIKIDGNLVHAKSKNGDLIWIESSLLKPIVKGSKLKSSNEPIKEYILFPYEKDPDGKYKIISEESLIAKYPNGFSYLLGIKEKLEKRDNGKPNPVAWYAFGRAQGLDTSFGKKIIFSPMNRFPNFVLYDNPDCTVYSAYFIKFEGDYEALLSQLNSQRMADFIAVAGRDFRGGYKGYNKKALENFIITDLSLA